MPGSNHTRGTAAKHRSTRSVSYTHLDVYKRQVHGWQADGPVVARATLDAGREEFAPESLQPVHSMAELAERGYRPMAGEPRPSDPATQGATCLLYTSRCV